MGAGEGPRTTPPVHKSFTPNRLILTHAMQKSPCHAASSACYSAPASTPHLPVKHHHRTADAMFCDSLATPQDLLPVPCAADHAPGSQQSSSQLRPPPSPDALSLTLPDASVMPEYCPHLLSTFALGPGSIHRVGDHGIQTAGLPPSIMYGGAACPNDHPNLRASRHWTRPEHGGHYRALIHLPEPPAPAVCARRASIWPAPPPPPSPSWPQWRLNVLRDCRSWVGPHTWHSQEGRQPDRIKGED